MMEKSPENRYENLLLCAKQRGNVIFFLWKCQTNIERHIRSLLIQFAKSEKYRPAKEGSIQTTQEKERI